MEILLFKKEEMFSCLLPDVKQGKYWIQQKNKEGNEERLIGVEGINGKWELKSNKQAIILGEKNEQLVSTVLKTHEVVRLYLSETKETVLLFAEPIENNRKEYKKFKLPINGTLTIGRAENADIKYNNRFVSKEHAKLHIQNGTVSIESLSKSNGTFVNGNRVSHQVLQPGDMVYIMGLRLILGNSLIAMNNPDDAIHFNEHVLQPFKKIEPQKNENLFEDIMEEELDTYHIFYRSPRIQTQIEPFEVKIDSPTAKDNREETPLMLVLGPSVLMGMASLGAAVYAFQYAMTKTGNLRFAIPALVMSVCMLICTILFPILTRKHQAKKRNEREKLRIEKYNSYLQQIDDEIEEVRKLQHRLLHEKYLSVQACIEKIEHMLPSLWERKVDDEDFLQLRIGIGEHEFKATIKHSERKFTIDDDELQKQMLEIAERPKVLKEVPLVVDLKKHCVVGLVGEYTFTSKLAKSLFMQLIALHSYREVKIIMLYDKKNEAQWDFAKWVPHTWSDNEEQRYVATTIEEVKQLSNELIYEVEKRAALSEQDVNEVSPHFIVFAASEKLLRNATFIETMLNNKKHLNIELVQLAENYEKLPQQCTFVVKQGEAFDEIIVSDETTTMKPIRTELFEGENQQVIARKLANIRLQSGEVVFALPERLTFLEMYDSGKIEHLNALNRWQENDPTRSLQARIGVGTDGQWTVLDLHEKFHGPHGLIAGMTGSGKSEFIMTYILSLAVNYHPDEVSFILIDFKGGGMANTFDRLPHVAGTITNLDGAAMNRSLISIKSELERRQKLFNEASKKVEISNIDIYKYQKLYREGKVDEPLQHLMIISDEFAELYTQQPEFMEQLVSAARIGRSLGVHLILATQKPSGVVNGQIASNSKFRIALKVQDKADSAEVIGRPDAAFLKETGRYYLQVGYEYFELAQSAWSGAPYYPSEQSESVEIDTVSMINNIGQTVAEARNDARKKLNPDAPKQIDEIVKYLQNIAHQEKIAVKPIWLPPINPVLSVADLYVQYSHSDTPFKMNPIIGEVDDPRNQRKFAMTYNVEQAGNSVIYGVANSGKTEFVSTLMHTMMDRHTPHEVNFYVLDLYAETLLPFKEAPHVIDVVTMDEKEKVKKLIAAIQRKITERKNLFANYGGTYSSYTKLVDQKLPTIMFVVHNVDALLEENYDYNNIIANIARDGLRYGICTILTTATKDLRSKTVSYFQKQYVLQQNDLLDYTSILGKTGGIIPAQHKMRGIVSEADGTVYEFQVATAFKEVQPEYIKQFTDELVAKYGSRKLDQIKVMPKEIDLAYIESQLEEGEKRIAIGVNPESYDVKYYDFNQNMLHTILYQDYGNDAFANYCVEMLARQSKLKVIDPQNIMEQGKTYYHIADDMEQVILNMFELVKTRNNMYKNALAKGEAVPTFDRETFVFHSLSDYIYSLEKSMSDRFQMILSKLEPHYNVQVVIFDDSQKAKAYTAMEGFKPFFTQRTAIWIGKNFDYQKIITPKGAVKVDRQMDEQYGYVVVDGKATLVKLAYVQSTEEE